MNIYKLKEIINHIRSFGKLPTDAYGQRLSEDELLAWFELTERLSRAEQEQVKRELSLMIEAEVCMEQVRQAELMSGD